MISRDDAMCLMPPMALNVAMVDITGRADCCPLVIPAVRAVCGGGPHKLGNLILGVCVDSVGPVGL